MALAPATLEISWVSNYPGAHRVCYRVVGAPSYICTTAMTNINCPGFGAPCSYSIPITVDNESCAAVSYEGYVQAACELESSMAGRIPFNITFTPNPQCKQYEVTCDSSGVGLVILSNGGSGYSTAPLVSFVGSGSGATATAVLGNGGVLTLGSGAILGSPSSVATAAPFTGGSGTGLTITYNGDFGVVMSSTIINPGTGYVVGDSVSYNDGMGATVIFTITDVDSDSVVAVNVTNPGSGYTTAPSVVFTGANTTTAVATSQLALCDQFNLYDCDGVTAEVIPVDTNSDGFFKGDITVGSSLRMCSSIVPAVPASYTVSDLGACACDCREYTLTNSVGTATFTGTYQPCIELSARQSFSLAPGATLTICTVRDSIVYEKFPAATLTIVDNGPC